MLTCKIFLTQYCHDWVWFIITTASESVCERIVKCFWYASASYVIRDEGRYYSLLRVFLNESNHTARMTLLMLMHRFLYGFVRYDEIMKYVIWARSPMPLGRLAPVSLAFRMDEYPSLASGTVWTQLVFYDNTVEFDYRPGMNEKREGFHCVYELMFNTFKFPTGLKKPVEIENPVIDLAELEATANETSDDDVSITAQHGSDSGSDDEIQDQEASDEIQNHEASDEIQNHEASDEIQDPEASNEIQNHEASNEIQNQEASDEIQNQEALNENREAQESVSLVSSC
jgi:hypothetical protein